MKVETSQINKLFKILLIISFIYIVVHGIILSLHSIPSFDGAMNLQVPNNLFLHGTYATSYDQDIKFDLVIQSGCTIIFPTTLMFYLLGNNFVAGNIVALIYMMLAIYLTCYFIYKKYNNYMITIIMFWILVTLPYFYDTVFGLYGEIATYVFLMLSIILYDKLTENNKTMDALLMGVCLGAGVLTKTVIMIAFPFIALLGICDLIFLKKVKLRNYLIVFFSFIAIFACFELFKLSQLGVDPYIESTTTQLSTILKQTGVVKGYETPQSRLDKLLIHYDTLCNLFSYNKIVFVFITLINLIIPISALYNFFKKNYSKIKYSEILLWCISMAYLGWWLLFHPTSKLWPRRIIIGIIVLLISTLISVLKIAYYSYNNKQKAKVILTISIIILTLFIRVRNVPKLVLEDTQEKTEVMLMSEYVKGLPKESKFFGYSWWQNPVIAFASQVKFYDLEKVKIDTFDELNNMYFVVDPYGVMSGNQQIEPLMKTYEMDLIINYGNNYLYKIVRKKDEFAKKDFTNETQMLKEAKLRPVVELGYAINGNIDSFNKIEDKKMAISGWLYSVRDNIKAIYVVDQNNDILADISERYERPDVAIYFNDNNALRSGFNARVLLQDTTQYITIIVKTNEGEYISINNLTKQIE